MKKLILTLIIIAGLFITADAQRARPANTIRPVQTAERRHIRAEERRRHKIARKLRHRRQRTAMEIFTMPQYMKLKETGKLV
jgi:hypothetical protein